MGWSILPRSWGRIRVLTWRSSTSVVTFPEGSVRLPLGDSDTLAPGDDVTAVGYRVNSNPVATRAVPTNGIVQDLNVSATVDPSLPEYVGAIQHGATLQPASSGGPLLDNRGNVVGVNAMAGPADRGSVLRDPDQRGPPRDRPADDRQGR